MIEMALSHTTDEQGINSAMMLGGSCARQAFHLARFVIRHNKKKEAAAHETERENPLLSDACSAYRGGYTSTDSPEVDTLLRDLSGSDELVNATADKPFFWLGDKSDLSYFWKKTGRDTNVMLPRSTIDEIPDEALRSRVLSNITQARIEGSVVPVGDVYFLTDEGRKKILKPDFIKNRLVKECEFLGIATNGLEDIREQKQNDYIDKRLEELGLTGHFDGRDRVTINKETLLIDDTADDVARFVVPGTSRQKQVDIPKTDLVELDEKSYAAFLRKDAEYMVNGKPMPEAELFAYFHNKNKRGQQITTTYERAEQCVADEEAEAARGIKPGDQVHVIQHDGTEAPQYTVDRMWSTTEGNHVHLRAMEEGRNDLLLPESALGHIMFHDQQTAMEHAEIAPEDVERYSRVVSEQMEQTRIEAFLVPASNVEMVDGAVVIHPKDAPWESVTFRGNEAQMQPDGSAIVNLRPNASYTVKSGDVSYQVSEQGVQQLLKDVSKPVSKSAQKAAQKTAETAGRAAEKAAEATAVAADTTAKVAEATTGGTAAPVMEAVQPVTDTVSSTAKLASGQGEAATDTMQTVASTTTDVASKVTPAAQSAKLLVDVVAQAQKLNEAMNQSQGVSLKL